MALYPPTFQSYIGYRAFISFYRKRGKLPIYVLKIVNMKGDLLINGINFNETYIYLMARCAPG